MKKIKMLNQAVRIRQLYDGSGVRLAEFDKQNRKMIRAVIEAIAEGNSLGLKVGDIIYSNPFVGMGDEMDPSLRWIDEINIKGVEKDE